MAQEKIQATIPASNKWHTGDIEEKAKALGMEKGIFILEAIDMLVNLDEVFYGKIQTAAEQFHIPVWLYIQNTLIKGMAKDAAKVEAGTWKTELHDEFMFVTEADGNRTITGEELFNSLKSTYVTQEKQKLRGDRID